MKKCNTFKTSYVEKTKAKPETLWKIWQDVDKWSDWDSGIQSAKLLSTFSTGGKFLLTPVGSPVAIEVELSEVIPNEKFIEFANLSGVTIEICNEMTHKDDITTITHCITATIEESCADNFYETMWQSIEKGLPLSIKNAVLIAEKNSFNDHS